MLKFLVAGFAVAGLIAAAGPVVIHLLNRRRFRVVEWAAMDFLREALQRNRRILQFRDLILLLLRVAALLLVGLALARPFFTTHEGDDLFRSVWPWGAVAVGLFLVVWTVVATDRVQRIAVGLCALIVGLFGLWGVRESFARGASGGDAAVSGRQPVHAVLIVDNTRSMGYETLDGDLLQQAKAKAKAFVEQLPLESRITVLPLASGAVPVSLDAYRSRAEALEALRRIELTDAGGTAAQAAALARQACAQVPELEAKRIVFLGDQQLSNWPAEGLRAALEDLPEMQVVQVAAERPGNVWVADFRVQDGVADTETPASFLTTIAYDGDAPLDDVQVTLKVDGTIVAGPTVSLEPGQERELEFRHRIDALVDPGRPTFVVAEVEVTVGSLAADGLKRDNRRSLAVPVVAGLPVVFVDQFGSQENPDQNKYGETYRLRRLLAPKQRGAESVQPLIRIRHKRFEELEESDLGDARLVVMAGVPSPDRPEIVDRLREFVVQGGQLVIAAGGEFDPAAWTRLGWKEGRGILPLPLDAQPVGRTPEEVVGKQALETRFLAFESLMHDYFRIEQESEEALRDLYRQPLFFKVVAADADPATIDGVVAAEKARVVEDRRFVADAANRERLRVEKERTGTFGPADEAERAADERRLREIAPTWLAWNRESVDAEAAADSPDDLAARARPRVLGTYAGSDVPFAVEQNLGKGQILFVSTGVQSSWSTLTLSDAILVFDRILRAKLERTLPRRNFETGERIVLPAARGERLVYALRRPGSETDEELPVEAFGPQAFGTAVRQPVVAGTYTVTERRRDPGAADETAVGDGPRERRTVLCVTGPTSESELVLATPADLKQRVGEDRVKWVDRTEEIRVEGARIRGRDLWKLLVKVALGCLLAEMLVLSLPAWPRRAAPGVPA